MIYYSKIKMSKPEAIGKILNQTGIGRELQREKNRQKRQLARVKKKKNYPVPTEMHSMELSPIFNTTLAERKKGWCRRDLWNGKYIEAGKSKLPNDKGLIQGEDLSVLLGCFLFLKHTKTKHDKYTFETTPYQMLRLFGEDEDIQKDITGGRDYQRLRDSLSRLQSNNISTNFWWDTIKRERIVKYSFHFLESVGEGEQKSLRIRLSKDIADSIEKGYVKYLTKNSLLNIIRLRGHAKILALYLLKLAGYKKELEQNLETILRLLGLEDKYKRMEKRYFNRYTKEIIIPAMKRASETIGFHCEYKKEEKKFYLHRPFSLAHKQK